MKNALIDALEMLLHPQDPGGRWQAAQDLAGRMGIQSILVGKINLKAKQFSWISTDMPGAWMEEYIAENYSEIDPIINELRSGSGRATIECGTLRRDQVASHKDWNLNHGLKASGFETLHSSYFGSDLETGKAVTLCYAGGSDSTPQTAPLDTDLLSGLLVSTITHDSPPEQHSYHLQPNLSPLTQRQREVLSLLAEGMMTARIAEHLGISQAAVTLHFSNARKALGASTREHALALALSRGLISL